jgi:hypothetical protein
MRGILLDPHAADRLAKLCGMFGSDHDGERATAASKADEFVRSLGLTWRDVIVAPPLVPSIPSSTATDWQRMAAFCNARRHLLSEREVEFIRSMLGWRGKPTERQQEWLTGIYARLHRGAGS